MESIFGGLFEFETSQELEDFVSKLDKTTALKILELVIDFGQQKGMYSLTESHCIYKCLSKLKQNENKDQGSSLHNDDNNGSTN